MVIQDPQPSFRYKPPAADFHPSPKNIFLISGWNMKGIAGILNEQRLGSLARQGIKTMKLLFIRIFALAMLTNSILAFGASSPCKDEKMPACPAPAASSPQTNDDEHCAKKMKKEKKMKKKGDQQKQDDNYPGYGVFG